MTKQKSTKRALLLSALSLLMCVSMLIGSTFAWFTDSVTSSGNKIQAGTLDVQLHMYDGTDYVDISDSVKPIFGEGSLAQDNAAETLWEPGKTQIVYLAVKNAGSLALKYNIILDVVDDGLLGSLDYAIIDGATKNDAATTTSWNDIIATAGVQTGLIQSGRTVAANNGALEAEGYDYFALAVHMKEEAGNEYQGKNVVIDINLVATQLTSESDSFGNDYDADAELPIPPQTFTVDNVPELREALNIANDGDVIKLTSVINTSDAPITEEVIVDKKVTIQPNGMYLVSSAPATFKVVEGGKLTIDEGSFTVKNIATEGAAILVDGGEFVMAGGSFDAHTAVRTTEGKSSTVTLEAGWSNRVTVGFDLKGNDTLNVTGGSLYTSKEAVKTAANTTTNINISGGLLSSSTTQYSAAIQLNGPATVDMTGGTVAATYLSGLNGSSAIEANVAPTVINISGTAKLEAKGWGVVLGSHWSSPAVMTERFTLNVSGDSVINVNGDTGFGIRYCQDACDVSISGNAKVSAKFQAIQMNCNSYVFENSTLTISENANISSTAGRYGGGYGVAAYGNVTITGGTFYGSTYGVVVDGQGPKLVIDNSESGTPIIINNLSVGANVDYTYGGDWNN